MMCLKRDVGMNLDRNVMRCPTWYVKMCPKKNAGMNQEKSAIMSQGKSVIQWQKNILIMSLLRNVVQLIFLYADLYLERNARMWKKSLLQLYLNKTATRSLKRSAKMWLRRFV